MNRIQTLTVLFYFLFNITSIHSHVTENITVSTTKHEIIPFVSERLKKNINKLFYCLKINKKFRRSYKTKLLLIMYDNLNNAIEFNWITYNKIKNSVVVADYIKNNYFYKLVTDVLKITDIEQNNSRESKILTFALTNDEKNVTAVNDEEPILNASPESTLKDATPQKDVLDKLLYKINKLTAEDLIYHPINKTYLEIDENKRYKIFRRRNFDLKTWDPNELPDDRLSMTRRMAKAELVKKFPFIASIHVMERFTCTGSIISKNAVITAASCLPFSYDRKMIQQMPDIIQVRIGSDYANHYGEKVPIADVEFHPKYDTKTLKNNIAIIRMNKLQKYARSRPKIRKIRLDKTPGGLRSNLHHVQILGFGAGNEDLKADNQQLVVVNLDLMPLNQCKDVYSGQFVNGMDFCAGFRASRRNSHCNGDVGAPGVADGHLVGIVSFGPPVCGRHDAPTVFIKIGIYTQWIDSILNQKFKLPNPAENSGSREFRSTRLYMEEDEDPIAGAGSLRTTPNTPNFYASKHHVFKEIKSILKHMSDPIDHHRYTRKPPTKIFFNYDEDVVDDPYKFVSEGTETPSAIPHPLLNKSVLPIPGIHYPVISTTYKTTTKVRRPDIGLPDGLPYDYIAEHIKSSSELDFYIKLLLKNQGRDGSGKLPWKKRGKPKILSSKTKHSVHLKDNKANLKDSYERKMEIISKNIQQLYKQEHGPYDDVKLQLRKNAEIDEGSATGAALKPREESIFGRYGRKMIGHKIKRPFVTLLDINYNYNYDSR